jgi:hypothetical protein
LLRFDEGDAAGLSDPVSVLAREVFGGGDHGEEGYELADETGSGWRRRVELEVLAGVFEPAFG